MNSNLAKHKQEQQFLYKRSLTKKGQSCKRTLTKKIVFIINKLTNLKQKLMLICFQIFLKMNLILKT